LQYSPYHPLRKFGALAFDPLSVTAMALTGVGAGISAANTIAGGNYAAQAGRMKQTEANFEADQDVANAAGETAAAQRQAIDISHKANLLRSSAVANTAATGVNAGAGSALTNQAGIAARGRYQADMDLWSGQNQASGSMNRAAGKRYTGEMDLLGGEEAQRASTLNALSTIAGGGASFMRMYGGKGLY